MRLIISLVALFLFQVSFGQDLNGIWRGTLTQEPGGCFPVYNLEIQIVAGGDRLQGKAFDYYDKTRFVKHHFTGRYNTLNKRMVLIEDRVLEVNIPGDCVVCTKTYDLSWSKENGREALTGTWKGVESDSKKNCPPGKITLYRVATTEFPVDIDQPEELAKLQQSIQLAERETEIVRTLELDTPNIKIDLYDNAEIDNDTVTIFLNNKLLLYKQRLTQLPLSVSLKAFPDTDYELLMYADNLGSIPPNTALMVVTAGKNKYEVRLSASDKKNAAVRFRLKQER
ncbi:hypothetical protein ACFSQD_04275 [Flavihumibacter stibioxidans]|uniref:Lipocalin-like domain-containing protein n=1 Tax=Flavihumibacter stibioxidans TaxID=1834163 RepID=A0ABR7M3U8_9BACT|nr:hypothetical protein [Flavihumibacter stibioxidans]MBC6489524.1 hypothetical protein [Flavihumibacter stibioxidans]